MPISEQRSGGGFSLGSQGTTTFTGVDQAAAELSRDNYFTANPTILTTYDSNPLSVIRLIYNDGEMSISRFMNRTNGAWTDVTPVLQGPSGSVASLDGVPIGEVPYKLATGNFGGSGMRVLDDGSILAPPHFGVESGSVSFGDVLTVSESSGFLAINNHINDKQYTIVDYATPRNAASSVPSQFRLTSAEFAIVAQGTDTTNIPDNPLIFMYTVVNTARSNALTFRAYGAMLNVRMKVTKVSNGVALKYFPSKTSWEKETGGVSWIIGDNTIDFEDTPVILNSGEQIQFEIRANVVSLKGNASGIPYFTGMIQLGEFVDIITDKLYTASDIKSKLESLSTPNKLGKTAIEDVVNTVNGSFGDVVITKTSLGLGNADNTSDVNKPTSTAQQASIDLKMSQHNAAVDPHPQYTTPAEASAAAPVQTVNGLSGTVVLSTANITESGNLYYSDSRVTNYLTANGYIVKSASSIGSGSAVYKQNSVNNLEFRSVLGSGLITLTQNANDITVSAPNVTSGTYTPIVTNVVNTTSSTAFQCQYMRVGSVVSVSGMVTIDPTSNNQLTSVGISLPIASNIGAIEDCSGTAACADVAGQSAAIIGDIGLNRATLQFIAGSSASHNMSFHFMYEILV